MLKILLARLQQKHRTIAYPHGPPPPLPDRFRGCPILRGDACPDGCRLCADACPTGAISPGKPFRVDLGKCLFCTDCADACPAHHVTFGTDYRLAARARKDLVLTGNPPELKRAAALDGKMKSLFGRSLKFRQVSAGGCNACEADTNVLNTVGWDLSRFGIQFVASPRHADGLLITGPVTRNMELALRKTYEAVPAPKLVVAVGACAISGGPYADHDQTLNGAAARVPVDLYIPGCPPHPLTILDGLLRLLDRIS